MRRSLSLALLTSMAALASLPAGAADPTTVDQLSATVGATAVSVTGSATFRDVPVQTGTDAAGDALAPGTDLIRSSISAPVAGRARFRLEIADPIPGLSSNPGAVSLWPVTVDGSSDNLFLHGSRARVGVLPTDPHLRVVRIADGSIATVANNLPGTMADGIVEWDVPLSAIGAQPGSVVTSDGAITVVVGISGVGTVNQNYDTMFAEGAYTVPSRTVMVGIGPAGAPDEAIGLNTPATVGGDGSSFAASLPLPAEPGDYKVVVRACFGPQSCGTSSADLIV